MRNILNVENFTINLLLLLFPILLFSRTDNEFQRAFETNKEIYIGIKRLQINDLVVPTAALSLSITSSYYDSDVREYFQSNRSEFADIYFDVANYGGEPITIVLLPSAIYAAGSLFDEKELKATGRFAFHSILLSGATTFLVKSIVGRARPYKELGAGNFEHFTIDNDFSSYPSGHTTIAFALATVLADRIESNWATPLLYGFAASTGIARIYKDKHWLSDVILGAAIGTISAKAVLSAEKRRIDKNKSNTNNNSHYRIFSISLQL